MLLHLLQLFFLPLCIFQAIVSFICMYKRRGRQAREEAAVKQGGRGGGGRKIRGARKVSVHPGVTKELWSHVST